MVGLSHTLDYVGVGRYVILHVAKDYNLGAEGFVASNRRLGPGPPGAIDSPCAPSPTQRKTRLGGPSLDLGGRDVA